MLFYDVNKEYFTNCEIHKYNNSNLNDKYYKYGALQLLYVYFTTTDISNKNLILNTYNDKVFNNALNLTHKIDLTKLSRDTDNLQNKKIILSQLTKESSEWAKCEFKDLSTKENILKDKILEDGTVVKNELSKSGKIIDNNIYFNRISEKELCNNIIKLTNDNARLSSNNNIILLKINLDPIELLSDLDKPEIINIKNIRIVKYNYDNKNITEYNTENYFIDNFFKLDTKTSLFLPFNRKVVFYKFSNTFCNNLYDVEHIFETTCFNINQLGFESIKFSNNAAKFLEDSERIINENQNCQSIIDSDIDIIKDNLKNKLLDDSRTIYQKCSEKIKLSQARDKNLRKHKNDKCVKKNVYRLKHCKFKNKCLYHNIHCNYERDHTNLSKFKKILNNAENMNDIDANNFDLLLEDSDKVYNICDKYVKMSNDNKFAQQYNKINELITMKDDTLNNFDNNSELYIDFEMLKYVSQDNSIYIFIDNK